MKKIFALILAVTMLLSTLALVGCGANNADDNASSEAVAEVDVVDALKNIWDNYEDENKFAAMGGGMANPVTDGPGELSLDDTAEVNDKTGVPEDKITTIDKAATLVHMMNANTFSAAAVHAAEGVKAEDVATTIGDNLNQFQEFVVVIHRQQTGGFLVPRTTHQNGVLGRGGDDVVHGIVE